MDPDEYTAAALRLLTPDWQGLSDISSPLGEELHQAQRTFSPADLYHALRKLENDGLAEHDIFGNMPSYRLTQKGTESKRGILS